MLHNIQKLESQDTQRAKYFLKILIAEGFCQELSIVLINSTIYISTFEVIMLIKSNVQLAVVLSMYIQSFIISEMRFVSSAKLILFTIFGLQAYTLTRLQVTNEFDFLSTFINIIYLVQQILNNKVFYQESQNIIFSIKKDRRQKNIANNLYKNIQQLIPEGLAVIDSNKQILYSNAALKRLLKCKNNRDLQTVLLNLGQVNNNENLDQNVDQEKKKIKSNNLFRSKYLNEETIKKNCLNKQNLININTNVIKGKVIQRKNKQNQLNTQSAQDLNYSLNSQQNKIVFQKSQSETFKKRNSHNLYSQIKNSQCQSQELQQVKNKSIKEKLFKELNLSSGKQKKSNLRSQEIINQKMNKEVKSVYFQNDDIQRQNETKIPCQQKQDQIQMQAQLANKVYLNKQNEIQLKESKESKCEYQDINRRVLSKVGVNNINNHEANQVLEEIKSNSINYEFNSNINIQGLEKILKLRCNELNILADNHEEKDQQINHNLTTENNKTIESLRKDSEIDYNNAKSFRFKKRPKTRVTNQITKETIGFCKIIDRLFEDTQSKVIQEQTEGKFEEFNNTIKQKSNTQLQAEFNPNLNYIQQIKNITNLYVKHQNKDLVIKLIAVDLLLEDQKTQEPLVFIIVQELWQDLYQKKVEELQKEKMKIFGTLSHELRTPLNCSISMLEILKDELSNDQKNQFCIEEYIVPALFSNKLLLNQVNDILDFVQMDCSKFKYSFVDFNLVSLLKDCCKLVSVQAKMKSLEIQLAYDQKINQIICSDPNRIRQIILNFLSNSLKFTKFGQIELGVVQVSKNIYNLYVQDTGIGISQDNQQKIFNFCNKIQYQNKEEEQLNKQGCGLGLLISNTIAQGLVSDGVYKGGITVESKYGIGSKFSILVQDFNNSDENKINEQQVDQNKFFKSSFKRIDTQIGQEEKHHILNNQISLQNYQQSINSTKVINENDISETGKYDNSYYGFVQEDRLFNLDKHENSNKDNIIINSKQEKNKIVTKSKFLDINSNLSSSQVIEEAPNQDLRFNLNNIFQIQIHKNFQEDENQESKITSQKQKHRISLRLQSQSSSLQSQSFSQFQQNAEPTNSNKLEQNIQQKLSQNQIVENQNRKVNSLIQAIHHQQQEEGFINYEYSNNTGIEVKNEISEAGNKMQSSMSMVQQVTTEIKQLQNSKLQLENKEENEYEQEGFTSYASQIKIKGQYIKKLTTSSINENFKQTYSFKSQISCFKTTDVENNLDINKNEKNLTPQQKLDQILEFNLNKKRNCKCPQLMIVDDNQFNLYAIQKIIEKFQFEIVTFSDGDQAIKFIKTLFYQRCCPSPQIILMDIEMPVKNGYETVQEIIQFYKSVEYNNIPIIIACTSYVGQEDCDKCIESGMRDFINKPILKTGFQNLILNYYKALCNKNSDQNKIQEIR
ncbi:hypothetical protein ABPG72_003267 [Tetrahymena utriculariae]